MTEQRGASAATSGALVPDWLTNLAALGWRVLVVASLVVVLWLVGTTLWTVTASVAVAIVISAVFAPFVLRLREQGRSRNAAAGIVWAAAILTVVAILVVLAIAFLPYLADLVARLRAGVSTVGTSIADLGLPAWAEAIVADASEAVVETAGSSAAGIVASAASAVTILILSSFLVFFFLRDGDKAWLWMFQALGEEKRERITQAGDEALSRVGGYLRGTTILSAFIALTDLLFMWLLGVPLALPLAMLAFLAGFIPYFGGIVATGIILLVSLAAIGGGPTLVLLLLMGARGVVLGSFVRPAVYGRTVRIHPALVLIALPAGFQLGGIVGLLAAVPVTAVLLAVAGAVVAIVEPFPVPVLPGLVPAWLDRLAQFSWRILVGIGLIALLVAILVTVPLVVIPIVLGLILAATLAPLALALVRRGWSRGRAAAASVGGASLAVITVLLLSFASLFEEAGSLAGTVIRGAEQVDEASGGQLAIPAAGVAEGAGHALSAIATVVDATATLLTVTALGVLLAFYFLRDGAALWDRVMTRVRADARAPVDAAGTRAFDVLGGYMIGTGAISLVGAASQLAIMLILGLPLALPVFVLSFFLCFIPYIGGFISTGVAFLIAVAVGSTTDVLILGAWTVVFNIVQGNVVSPIVYGRTVHIHPAIVLVAIPAGSAVAGILGMFIVVPAIGVVATTWRTVIAVMGQRAATSIDPGAPSEARPSPP